MNSRQLARAARIALAVLALAAGGQALACYTVYDRSNRIVYNAQKPPVDMSKPLSETLQAAYPGGHLVFDNSTNCPLEPQPPSPLRTAAQSGRTPLLTDANTANSMGLSHTPIGNGVVVVPDRPASMRPGVVLADSIPGVSAVALPADNTAVMGAPAARPQPLARPAGPAVNPDPTRPMGVAPAR